jgi:hypothetical protein
MQHQSGNRDKQPYEKPKVKVIELKAEEVLGIGCKIAFGDPKGLAGHGCATGICSSSVGS